MSISRTSRMRRRPAAAWLPLGALLLAACGDFAENIPPRPAASDDPAIVAAPYPNLAAVPARPQLGYTLEQRREIARGLVADRANARHAGDTLRGDLGRPVEPDTAPPLPPLPVAEPPPAADPEADLALAYVEEALARDSDDGSLGDFLDRLERRPPASAEAAPAPPPVPSQPIPPDPIPPDPGSPDPGSSMPEASEATAVVEVAPAPAADAREPAPEVAEVEPSATEPIAPASVPAPVAGVAEPAGQLPPEVAATDPVPEPPTPEPAPEVAATAAAEPSPAAVAEAAVPSDPVVVETAATAIATLPAAAAVEPLPLPLAVLFEPGQVQVAEESRARLEQVGRQLRGNRATVVVNGGGARPGLAIERARRVAALLVSSGVPPGRIAIEMGGERDAVVVYEIDA